MKLGSSFFKHSHAVVVVHSNKRKYSNQTSSHTLPRTNGAMMNCPIISPRYHPMASKLKSNFPQINSKSSMHLSAEAAWADFYPSEAPSHAACALKSAVRPQLRSHPALKLEQRGTPATSSPPCDPTDDVTQAKWSDPTVKQRVTLLQCNRQ